MKDKHATRRRVLLYLAWFGADARLWIITEHMQQRYGVDPHVTRQMLWRLTKEGRVTRTRRGYYQIVGESDAGRACNTSRRPGQS